MEERNLITGMIMNKRDDSQEYNSITGQYHKSDDAQKWPTISKQVVVDYDEDDELEDAQVSKSSDSKWPSISGQADDNNFSKNIPIFIEKSKDEQIVYGIVYEPDTVDTQGDQASAKEIEKAANDFMENVQTFKIMHKGKPAKVKVLQSFIAPVDYTIAKRKVKKGSWVLVTRVLDKKLWKDIKAGKFTGYSMAGYAKVEEN